MKKNIEVVVKIRPFLKNEKNQKCFTINKKSHNLTINQKQFKFNQIINISEQENFNASHVNKIIKNISNGINTTTLCYGSSSCGKTYTINKLIKKSIDEMDNQGIFHAYESNISVCEIYKNKIGDLYNEKGNKMKKGNNNFTERKNLKIKQNSELMFFVEYLRNTSVKSKKKMMKVINVANENKKIDKNSYHKKSSRSHTIFQIDFGKTENGIAIKSRVVFVDLAGSERQQGNTPIKQLHESKFINKSIASLRLVITELSDGKRIIRYRDSPLTKLLKNSLGGNSKTTIIICISPSVSKEKETENSLNFGSRAKLVKNRIKINQIIKNRNSKIVDNLKEKMKGIALELIKKDSALRELTTEFQKEKDEKMEMREEIEILKLKIISLEECIKSSKKRKRKNEHEVVIMGSPPNNKLTKKNWEFLMKTMKSNVILKLILKKRTITRNEIETFDQYFQIKTGKTFTTKEKVIITGTSSKRIEVKEVNIKLISKNTRKLEKGGGYCYTIFMICVFLEELKILGGELKIGKNKIKITKDIFTFFIGNVLKIFNINSYDFKTYYCKLISIGKRDKMLPCLVNRQILPENFFYM